MGFLEALEGRFYRFRYFEVKFIGLCFRINVRVNVMVRVSFKILF